MFKTKLKATHIDRIPKRAEKKKIVVFFMMSRCGLSHEQKGMYVFS